MYRSFIRLHSIVHPRAVTEFVYRYRSLDIAHVFISFQLEGKLPRAEEVSDVIKTCAQDDLHALDISNDELAKSHARYMIGGRQDVENERVFRFRECLRLVMSMIQADRRSQSFQSVQVPCATSCWGWMRVGISHCSTIATTVQVRRVFRHLWM
jgi:hypothetical protein